MFNNNYRSAYHSLQKDSKYKSLPLQSNTKSRGKYITPNKSKMNTYYTNNQTYVSSQVRNNLISSKTSHNTTKITSKSCPLTQGVTKMGKDKSKQKSKTIKKNKNNHQKHTKQLNNNKVSPLKTNKQCLTNISKLLSREGITHVLLRISEIFDLITLKEELPFEIQTILSSPLYHLRKKLKAKCHIGQTLTQFKNNCLQAIKKLSASDFVLFQRLQLPNNNRWKISINQNSTIKRQQQGEIRQKYFQSLKKKNMNATNYQEESLNKIEKRLNTFLQDSLKHRRVYF